MDQYAGWPSVRPSVQIKMKRNNGHPICRQKQSKTKQRKQTDSAWVENKKNEQMKEWRAFFVLDVDSNALSKRTAERMQNNNNKGSYHVISYQISQSGYFSISHFFIISIHQQIVLVHWAHRRSGTSSKSESPSVATTT